MGAGGNSCEDVLAHHSKAFLGEVLPFVRMRAWETRVRSPTCRAGRTRFNCEVQKQTCVRACMPDLGKEILVITRRCDGVVKLAKYETWCFQVYLLTIVTL